MEDGYDDIFNSSSADDSFEHATLIATLAERFSLTAFKPFQKMIINAALEGPDTMVVHPTGSGKSLCFQFPPVYQNKKAVIITLTISLMQDQVQKLNKMGIPATFVGSAQLDKRIENGAFAPDSKEALILVTPEWVAKCTNRARLHSLVQVGKLSLIAIDEAHLFTEWNDFRSAFSELRKLKTEFGTVPIMALTATATKKVEDDIKLLLRNPVTSKSSMNRQNITLRAEEIAHNSSLPRAVQFAKRAAEIIQSTSSIIYTDFIKDIGPIVSALEEVGVEAVGYHGEMDAPSRHESYMRWKSGQVQTIVATKAFGMGIDKPDIRHVVRNGVPESLLSWAQELGRAGRDESQACATILYHKSDISHANPWVLNNISDKERSRRILSCFSEPWRFVNAHLAGVCRKRLLLNAFGEVDTLTNATGDCCYVCLQTNPVVDFKEELKILLDALNQVGYKGELKIAEWIRGSNISWTNSYDKSCLSYGNNRGKDLYFWRMFIKQCHVMSFVQLELRSMIKSSGHYAVNCVYCPTPEGIHAVNDSAPFLLPMYDGSNQTTTISSMAISQNVVKNKRLGKGTNTLTIIRKLSAESKNWLKFENKSNYQFPGVLTKESHQQLIYIQNISDLEQSSEDPHFVWKDIQLSKGQLNRD